MRRLLDERPRVAIAATFAAIAVIISALLLVGGPGGGDSGQGPRAVRAELQAGRVQRAAKRARRELTATRRALGATTRRARKANRRANANLSSALRWKARARRVERKLRRSRR